MEKKKSRKEETASSDPWWEIPSLYPSDLYHADHKHHFHNNHSYQQSIRCRSTLLYIRTHITRIERREERRGEKHIYIIGAKTES